MTLLLLLLKSIVKMNQLQLDTYQGKYFSGVLSFCNIVGLIEGLVIGSRRHCREAGGMEIPCRLTFTGKKNHIAKLRQLIISLNSQTIFVV